MTPILCVLLCLGLCLNQRMMTQADRPSLSSDMGSLVPLGSSVTLRCQGSLEAENYTLGKEQEPGIVKIIAKKPAGGEVEFLIPTVTAKDAGKYYCSYKCSSAQLEPSAALELMVTDVHEPPSLSAWPSSQVTPGQQVTLQCHSKRWYDSSALYKDGREMERQGAQPQGWGAQANFSILAGTPGGMYRCYSFNSTNPYEWSAPSNSLLLRVPGPGTTKDPHLPQSSGEPQAQTSSPPSTGTTKDPHLPDSPGNPQTPISSQPEIFPAPKSGHSQVGIFIGISVFLILVILFLLFLRYHRRRQRQTRLRNGGREEEAKKTPRSSDPAGTPLEETQYAVVNKDRQTEEARPEDLAVSPRNDTQEVTYTQLNLNSLKAGVKDPTTSGSQDPTVYAALR